MKTAVEWLIETFKITNVDLSYHKLIIEQAKEMEQQQMLSFGKAVADYWGMMPVPMSNVKDLLNTTKPTWRGNPVKNGTDLDMEMFAFLTWLDFNRDVETIDGLLRKDGYDWYNSQWKAWLHNSDAGQRVLNYSGTVSWWGGNPDMNKNDSTVTREKTTSEMEAEIMEMIISKSMSGDNKTGETTIEFPAPHVPEQYNLNIAQLDTIDFNFYQEANCVDGGEGEHLTVEAKSSLGIDGDGGAFYVLRTEQWAINDIDDLIVMLKRVEAALNAVKPTSIHVK
jgi:hypothetical protein